MSDILPIPNQPQNNGTDNNHDELCLKMYGKKLADLPWDLRIQVKAILTKRLMLEQKWIAALARIGQELVKREARKIEAGAVKEAKG